jgi:predicted DNA-binding transcriptional regulator AlpA
MPKKAPRALSDDDPLVLEPATVVAQRLGVTRGTVWRWARTVPGFPQPIGGKFLRGEIVRYLESLREKRDAARPEPEPEPAPAPEPRRPARRARR